MHDQVTAPMVRVSARTVWLRRRRRLGKSGGLWQRTGGEIRRIRNDMTAEAGNGEYANGSDPLDIERLHQERPVSHASTSNFLIKLGRVMEDWVSRRGCKCRTT